jgi:phage replication-related protein YjqB (UPF0714/DUF867 family)
MDHYRNFQALSLSEIRGIGYTVRVRRTNSRIMVVAPHGGGIEGGTSEIATRIAASDHAFYLFEGKKVRGNNRLHLTSVRFDEHECLELLPNFEVVIALHGCRPHSSEKPEVFVGGLHYRLRELIVQHLRSQGFQARDDARRKGNSTLNICNRGCCGAGVQLEISESLRRKMFLSLSAEGRKHPTPLLAQFADAVRCAIDGLD